MKNQSAFMFFVFILLTYINLSSSMNNETDRQALLVFKDAITSPESNGILNSWNSSVHHCQWPGIRCSKTHPGRVTIIALKSQGLAGHLSPHIGNLSFLRILSLQNNTFYSNIPPEIGKLSRLCLLYLNNNSFQGEFPENLTNCINLKQIFLHVNNLTGKIPVRIGYLSNLDSLILGANNFEGIIPPSLGNISSLVSLHLGGARLEGNIPEALGKLERLQNLILHRNHLTGEIPVGIYNISSLTSISAGGNMLEGFLPPSIGNTLPNLRELYIRQNLLTGPIPISLSNCSNLQRIDLLNNSFSGSVPNELGKLVNLTWINLTANKFRGHLDFISHLANCTNLQFLLVGTNLLEGSLPSSIANLSLTIKYLQLGDNHIHGNIPEGIGNLVNLNGLELQYMLLEGSIPNTIGNLQNLVELYLGRNNLTGQILLNLDNLTFLNHLDLSVNKLTGTIPPSLGKSPKLLRLYLSENNLSGDIPASLFSLPSAVSINLSQNSLTGFLPAEVGNLKLVEELDLSHNKLSGEIPGTLGSCISLVKLHMSANCFQGKIPESLSALRGLDEINLSSNNLTGTIPEFFGSFSFLQVLDLSFNDLEGEVPELGVFRNSSAIFLSSNNKLCGGIPELKLPLCAVKDSTKGLSIALKVIIPSVVVALFLCSAVGFYVLYYRRKSLKQIPFIGMFNDMFIRISYQDLFRATSGFSETNLIGLGSYGSVYKGFLQQTQSIIAVKVFNLQHKGATKSFLSECKVLRNVRHRNLVKILSICSSIDHQRNPFMAIIYPFMPKGSLEDWIHASKNELNSTSLNLLQRLNIIIDVASAIEYLHCHCKPPIVHGDLKPSNVLLDDDMVAYVGDFGLAKVMSRDDRSSSVVQGSIGYVAPEYGTGEGVSNKGDIYSFGILILEMFTARRPTDNMFEGDMNLHKFIRTALPERVMSIVDSRLLQEADRAGKTEECLVSLLKIGLSCSMEIPKDRTEIGDVVKELSLTRETFIRKRIFRVG